MLWDFGVLLASQAPLPENEYLQVLISQLIGKTEPTRNETKIYRSHAGTELQLGDKIDAHFEQGLRLQSKV